VRWVDNVAGPLRTKLNSALTEFLNSSVCAPALPTPVDSLTVDDWWTPLAVTLSVVVAGILFLSIARLLFARKERGSAVASPRCTSLEPPLMLEVGWFWRALISLFLTGAFCARMYSLWAVVTEVRMSVEYFDADLGASSELFTLDVIQFTFTLMVRYFWHGKAYGIVVCLIGYCALLQISLLLFLHYVWFLPSPSKARIFFLETFGQLCKYSFADIVFTSLVILTFGTSFEMPFNDGSSSNVYLAANPMPGVFIGSASVCVSLLLVHLFIHLHLRAKGGMKVLTVNEPEEREGGREAGTRFHVALIFITGALLAYCATGHLLTIKTTGVVGQLKGSDATLDLSLVKIIQTIPRLTNFVGGHEGLLMSIFLTINCLVAPACVLLAWLKMVVRNDEKSRRLLLQVNSFQIIDTLFLILVVTESEVNGICEWVINRKFGWACQPLRGRLDLDCIHVELALGPAVWAMLPLALVFLVLSLKQLRVLGTCSGKGAYNRMKDPLLDERL